MFVFCYCCTVAKRKWESVQRSELFSANQNIRTNHGSERWMFRLKVLPLDSAIMLWYKVKAGDVTCWAKILSCEESLVNHVCTSSSVCARRPDLRDECFFLTNTNTQHKFLNSACAAISPLPNLTAFIPVERLSTRITFHWVSINSRPSNANRATLDWRTVTAGLLMDS